MTMLRLAVWSGPRNISTAMMRAWENRGDCDVVDEPLYAHYLAQTGLDHPGRDEIIACGETDWRKVVAQLVRGSPTGKPLFYQKHMTHHLLPDIERSWLRELTHVFLIRDPREVLASYLRTRATATVEDIGVLQELEIFEQVRQMTGGSPTVIDAGDFLRAPEAHLRALCAQLGIAFSPRMLHWPPGARPSDGVWAPYWYEAVWRSSGFEPWHERSIELPDSFAPLLARVMPPYETLLARRLKLMDPPTQASTLAARPP